jgi:thioredoxin
MSDVEEIAPADLQQLIDNETRPVIVDFWSPWCAPCRTLRPHIARLAQSNEETMRFVAVKVETDSEAAMRFNVRALPTVAMYRGGEETERLTGAGILTSISSMIASA